MAVIVLLEETIKTHVVPDHILLPLEGEAETLLRRVGGDALFRRKRGKEVHHAHRVVEVGHRIAELRVALANEMVQCVSFATKVHLLRVAIVSTPGLASDLLHERFAVGLEVWRGGWGCELRSLHAPTKPETGRKDVQVAELFQQRLMCQIRDIFNVVVAAEQERRRWCRGERV